MARFNFNFTGTIGIAAENVKSGTSKSGNKWKRFNCSVAEAKNNRAFCEVMGSEQNIIKTFDTDGDAIEISWDDRFDEEIVKTVASYRKHVIDLGDNRREFISDYDFVCYLEEHAEDLKDKKFTVTGQISENVYNGTISQRFQIQNLYAVADDVKNKLAVTMDFYWSVDDYDLADFKEDKKMYINGYVNTYIDKNTLGADRGANKYVPQQIIFDASKIDFSNEKHCQIMDFKLAMLGLKRDGEKLSTTLKKKKIYTIPVICGYLNGQEAIEFDASTLTPTQKLAYDLGIKTLEDFRPKGQAYGERVIEYRVRDFILKDESADGLYEIDLTEDEFADEKFILSAPETIEELEEKVEKLVANESSPVDEDEDLTDLFG